MKKLLSISLLASFLTFGIATGAASAKSITSTHQLGFAAASVMPAAQYWEREDRYDRRARYDRGDRWDRGSHTRFVTRTERSGFHLYRVTYRITNFRGRTMSQMVSRVRIR